jgi:hypothetical protein
MFLFGEIRYVDPFIVTMGLIFMIAFLATCEHCMNALENYLGKSPIYISMLQKIYRELMIMGLKFQQNPSDD